MVRRGERLLKRHLREVTKPIRGRGCLRTDLEAVGRIQVTSAVVKVDLVLRKLYHWCRPYNNDIHAFISLESLNTVGYG